MTRDELTTARQGCEDIAQEYLRQLDFLKHGGRKARRAITHEHLTEYLANGYRCLLMAAEALRRAEEEAVTDRPSTDPDNDDSLL